MFCFQCVSDDDDSSFCPGCYSSLFVPLFSVLYLPPSFLPPLSLTVFSPTFPVRSVCFLVCSLLFTAARILLEAEFHPHWLQLDPEPLDVCLDSTHMRIVQTNKWRPLSGDTTPTSGLKPPSVEPASGQW